MIILAHTTFQRFFKSLKFKLAIVMRKTKCAVHSSTAILSIYA